MRDCFIRKGTSSEFCTLVVTAGTRRDHGLALACLEDTSSSIRSNYLAAPSLYWLIYSYRMVHSFTCAGIIPSQYIHLSMFAGLGTVGHAYIRRGIYGTKTCTSLTFSFTVYNNNSYLEIVAAAAEHSMQSAVEEVKALPHYSTKGEVRCWIICIYFIDYSISVGDNRR